MEEIKIWEYVLNWGIAQMSEGIDLSNMTKENFIELGEILHDFIPLIRWNQISPKVFQQNIVPFKKIFPEHIFDDIIGYYMDPDSSPKSMILLQQRKPSFNSLIINKKNFALISSYIDNKEKERYNIKNSPYSFELLYSTRRDGFDSTKFHELCDDKGPTLLIAKINGTEKLIGACNPESWRLNTKSDKCFLFTFTNKNANFATIARCATNLDDSSFIHDPNSINLFDWTIKNNILECNSIRSFPRVKYLMKIGQKYFLEDYEVFKIIKLSELINNEEIEKSKINSTIEFINNSKHKIDKIYSTTKFTFQEFAKILVKTKDGISSMS
ncbi:hypothetical protein C1645_421358 [Glomus cerebriforme]|uniref:TLDc domain-containing protein n=1 Tax=Glomus cerebriforme TaxID=658196 RepID=A0A397TD28_9GLOM|nr:hypothetical protein C1645_421358 [Glomus cerebriforme]